MSRPSRLAIIALLAATAPATAEGVDFWVSVGSFKSFDLAQRLQAQAAQTLAEPVQMLPAEVAGQGLFRVVRGPYESRATAHAEARNAQAHGYADAWVLSAAGSAPAAPLANATPRDIAPLADDPLLGASGGGLALDAAVPLREDAGLDVARDEDVALADAAALDLDFDNLAGFDEFDDLASFAALDALDDLDDFDDLERLAAAPQTPPVRQPSFIETTEEPAWEAPPGFTLHRLPRPGDGAARPSFPDEPAGRNGDGGVMCKLVGWLPFVKSCGER